MNPEPTGGGCRSRRSYLRCLAGAYGLALAGCLGSTEPAIEVPDEARLDEPTPPVVTGLSADRATLTTTTTVATSAGTRRWKAETTYEVQDDRIDPAVQAPVDGGFDEPAPMGPFWSMRTRSSAETVLFPLRSHEVSLEVTPSGESDPVLSATTRRVLPDADSEPLGDDLVGRVHYPPTGGPAPGVLVLHGSGGRPLSSRARLLAGNGFVAATLDYFGGVEGQPESMVEIPIEYVQRAVDALASNERVAGEQVGVYGLSRGGELALLAGSASDRVGAVASVVGSGLVWAGSRRFDIVETSTWSMDDEPVPYVPIPRDSYPRTGSRPAFSAGFQAASRSEIEAATIPVEDVDGPVVLVSGRDDGLWNSVRYSEIAADRLERHDHPYRVEHLVYDDAGHLIRPPYAPTYGLSQQGATRLGGTPAGNARAAVDHWPKTLSILSDALGS